MTATVLNTKVVEVENKIPDSKGLVTTTVFNAKIGEVLNKISHVSGLVTKTYYNAENIRNWGKILYYFWSQ